MEKLMRKLAENRIKYESYRLFIEGNPFLGYEQAGDAFLFRGDSDGPWVYFVCSTYEEFMSLVDLLTPKDKQFAMVDEYMLEALLKRGELDYDMRAMRLYLPESAVIEETIPEGVHMRALTLQDVGKMYSHYTYAESASESYFMQRIQAFGGYGVEVEGELVGWILTHDDGALGVLHVLESHRGRGFAEALTRKLCVELRGKDILPTLGILPENHASMALALKLGFVQDRIIHWIKLKE